MRVLVAGDFCPRGRVASLLEKGEKAQVLTDVKKLTAEADYSVVNFECPVVEGDAKPLEKKGPNLRCTALSVEAIKWAGFDCVTLANNHILDYGDKGVSDTISFLEKNGIDYVGGGMTITSAAKILYKKIGDLRLAIINCCENEFSIATQSSAGANPLNPVQQYYAIQEAKKIAERVLVIVHGGHEHFQLPSPRMVETYRFFIDAGADAVVNHHQHCYSGYEVYKGKPIFYGLGNFCFDSFGKSTKKWTEGYAVIIKFEGKNIGFDVFPYSQCAEEPKVQLLNSGVFGETIKELNDTIANPNSLQKAIDEYYASCTEGYSNIFEPFFNRLFQSAKSRGLMPSLISKRRKLAAFNFIFCEAHRDKLMWWLKNS